MNRLEERILDILHHEDLPHEVIAKFMLQIAEMAYQEGYDDAFHHYQPDFEEFKKDIL